MEPYFEEESRKLELTPELEEEIVKRVRKILKKANLYQMSEKKVREEAAGDLGIDLSEEPFKSVVRQIVVGFLQQVQRERARAKEEILKQEKATSK